MKIHFLLIAEDPVLCIEYYPRFLIFFSKVVPDTNYNQKNFGNNFTPLKKGFGTGIKGEKKIFLNFSREFLVDLMPWYKT